MFKKLKLALGVLTLSLGLSFAVAPAQALDYIEEPTGPSTPGGEIVDPTETDPETEEAEGEDAAETDEPAMWPTYLSLGALGATFVLIVIINLLGRRKKS